MVPFTYERNKKQESVMRSSGIKRYGYVLEPIKKTKSAALARRNNSNKVSHEVREHIDKISSPILSSKNISKVIKNFHKSINESLSGKKSSMNCINTYIQDFPTGDERGRYLALDLGGTNFRSTVMDITDNGEIFTSKKGQVPENVRSSGGYELFEFMADFTLGYLNENIPDFEKNVLPCVFSFSFPVNMTAMNVGSIVSFSKGYNCKEIIGKDVGKLLIDAFLKVGIQIKLLGIINDTVGTMLARRWTHPLTAGGIVIGTGTNACYLEKTNNIKGYNFEPGKPLVVVNTEWGGFGDSGELDFLKTPFDINLDEISNNPGKQTMEKMVSGYYVGEIVRQTLKHLGQLNMFYSSTINSLLKEPFSFPSKIISTLDESEVSGNCVLCKPIKKYYREKTVLELLNKELNVDESTIKTHDFHIINEVCRAVSERGARIMGIAIACLAQRIDQKKIVFGIDATFYEKTLSYQKIMPQIIRSIVPEKEVLLFEKPDGSIKGAIYLAATLSRK